MRNIGAHADLGEIVEIDIQILTDFTGDFEYIYRAPVTHPTFEYHEKSSQEVAERNIIYWYGQKNSEIAIKEKAQADNKIRALNQRSAQEKKDCLPEDQKQQIIESWNKTV